MTEDFVDMVGSVHIFLHLLSLCLILLCFRDFH